MRCAMHSGAPSRPAARLCTRRLTYLAQLHLAKPGPKHLFNCLLTPALVTKLHAGDDRLFNVG
eukprot:4950435-Pyramimonas_sp.AAC.1